MGCLPAPSQIFTGRVRGFRLGEGVIGFLFHSQGSFYVISHRLGDQSCIHETQDCRRETQGLLDDMEEGKAGLFCSSAATCFPYPHPGLWATSLSPFDAPLSVVALSAIPRERDFGNGFCCQ